MLRAKISSLGNRLALGPPCFGDSRPLTGRARLSYDRARKVIFLESGVSDQGRQIIVQRPFPPPLWANSRTHRETNCPPISAQCSLIRADVTPELWALFVRAFRPWNLTRHTIRTWVRSRMSIYAGFEGVLLLGKSVPAFAQIPKSLNSSSVGLILSASRETDGHRSAMTVIEIRFRGQAAFLVVDFWNTAPAFGTLPVHGS
jgi:hypothetical protein